MKHDLALIKKYFPELDSRKSDQFSTFCELFSQWNSKINLVSRKDMDQFQLRHLLHSMVIARFADISPGSLVLDIGTGGGLPGLPLAIYFKEVTFHLVDSIRKKTEAVKNMADELGLNNVIVHNERVENLSFKVDFVVSRATAPLADLVKWSRNKFLTSNRSAIPNGIICLKGGDLTEELKPFENKLFIEEVSDYYGEDYFIGKKIIYLPIN
jgi:16S rRNA (guanine527-N7)-methyltransferase